MTAEAKYWYRVRLYNHDLKPRLDVYEYPVLKETRNAATIRDDGGRPCVLPKKAKKRSTGIYPTLREAIENAISTKVKHIGFAAVEIEDLHRTIDIKRADIDRNKAQIDYAQGYMLDHDL